MESPKRENPLNRWTQTPYDAPGALFCVYCQALTPCGCLTDDPLPQMSLDMKIISGGQTGADQGGLYAAARLGVESGGYAPKGWKTETGSASWLGSFGLVEYALPGYPPRTKANIDSSHATIIVGDISEPGSRLTLQMCERSGKPVLVLSYMRPEEDAVWQIRNFLWGVASDSQKNWEYEGDPIILNIAGNRESVAPGIQNYVTEILVAALLWPAWEDLARVELRGKIFTCTCGESVLYRHSVDYELFKCSCGQTWRIQT